jgi:signal transduction histidine kinase
LSFLELVEFVIFFDINQKKYFSSIRYITPRNHPCPKKSKFQRCGATEHFVSTMPSRNAVTWHHALHWLVTLLICCSAWAATGARAQDHITERAWLDDPQGQMRWPDIQNHHFAPYSGVLNKGFGHSVIWLRLKLDPDMTTQGLLESERLILRIRPVYLDDIQIFDPIAPGGLAGITGDMHPPNQNDLQSLNLLLPIARGTQARHIWLRLSSTSTRQLDIQALNESSMRQSALHQSLVFAGYLALVLLLAVWGIVHWLFSQDRLIGAFGIKQINALLFAICSLGYVRALWPNDWPAWIINEATNVFSITAVSAAVFFHVLLIREFEPPQWVHRLHMSMLALLPIKLALLAGNSAMTALQINMIEVLISPSVFLISVVLARGWKADAYKPPILSRSVAIGFYSVLVALLAMAALPALGITSGHEIVLYIVQVHGLVTAFLVLLMLEYRGRMIQKQQQEISKALDLSQMQAQQERTARQDQEKLLAMLAHELKTPLATIHMRLDSEAKGSGSINQAIRDMNNVIERCLQTSKLDDRQIVPRIRSVNLIALIHDTISASADPQRIKAELPQDCTPLATDPQLLTMVLNNLLENACKYAAPNTEIMVELPPFDPAKDHFITLRICNDAGPAGWPDGEKLFQKYYRSPHARRQTGSGLGLYLVRHLLHTLGGSIKYERISNRIHFVLRLPMTPASR